MYKVGLNFLPLAYQFGSNQLNHPPISVRSPAFVVNASIENVKASREQWVIRQLLANYSDTIRPRREFPVKTAGSVERGFKLSTFCVTVVIDNHYTTTIKHDFSRVPNKNQSECAHLVPFLIQ